MNLLKEPLFHFLLGGLVLFLIYGWVGDREAERDTIVVTQGKVDQIIDLWVRTRQRPPTENELKGLIDDWVIEEIMYREAKTLGLDEDDTIIRRRLRQKMEFIAEDFADASPPTDDQLHTYFEEHADEFALDARITFRHVFFNVDERGGSATDDAITARDQLQAGLADPERVGDGIPLPYELEANSTREISSMFGPAFADELLTLPTDGSWAGPVPSGYGIHLVSIREMQPGRVPDMAEVRNAVEREWSADRRKQVRDEFYASFRDRYDVVLEALQESPEQDVDQTDNAE